MDKYHKIQTVYKRDPDNKFKTLLEGEYSTSELELLTDIQWLWTEKIDGTNIRILYNHSLGKVEYRGKTDNAQIYPGLNNHLRAAFPVSLLSSIFDCDVCLYGEGFGAKIQSGGKYLPDHQSFCLFDIKVGDYWLERSSVVDIGHQMDCNIVSECGIGTLKEAIAFVRNSFTSVYNGAPAEGLVMRPIIELLDRRGERIITKIKVKDFRYGY